MDKPKIIKRPEVTPDEMRAAMVSYLPKFGLDIKDQDVWVRLAWKLIGIQTAPIDQPDKWSMGVRFQLLKDVETLVASGKTQTDACKELAKRPNWKFAKVASSVREPWQVLRERYIRYKRDRERLVVGVYLDTDNRMTLTLEGNPTASKTLQSKRRGPR